ncbi:MAG: YheT family hydrolase [Planctomycetaceae bacterium]
MSSAPQQILDQAIKPEVDSGDRKTFVPAKFLGHRHAQTIVPWLLTKDLKLNPIRREVQLDDGDRLVLQDDCPEIWADGDPVLLLLHGLSGCHMSAYMQRMALKANALGVRAFRLDHRGSGAGRGLAKYTYHAGRSEDVRAVLDEIEHVCPGSPVSISSYSLSANLMLKLLGEAPSAVHGCVHRVSAVSPPVDLSACVRFLDFSLVGRIYDRNFTKWLIKQVKDSPQWREDVPLAKNIRAAKRVIHFDELYTAPAAGYRDAAHYYAEASAGPRIKSIATPTLIIIARDDPMIPFKSFENLEISSSVEMRVTDRGGHLGFYGTAGIDPDRYWMDWRLLEWLFEK